MYDLGFLTDAIDTVKNLHENATTQVRLSSRARTSQIHIERGTIQGDTLSPFLFLLYMEPLLRWLDVGDAATNMDVSQTKTPLITTLQTILAALRLLMTSFVQLAQCKTWKYKLES